MVSPVGEPLGLAIARLARGCILGHTRYAMESMHDGRRYVARPYGGNDPSDTPCAWARLAEDSWVLPQGATSMDAELYAQVSAVAFVLWALDMGAASIDCQAEWGEALLRMVARSRVCTNYEVRGRRGRRSGPWRCAVDPALSLSGAGRSVLC